MLLFTASLGEGPGKQGERKDTAGEFGSMVKACSVVRFGPTDFSGVEGDKGQGYMDIGKGTKRLI